MLLRQVGLCLVAAILMGLFKTTTTSKEAMISINNKKWLHLVHDKFLSLTLEPRHLLFSEKFGTESFNMARALAPAFIRVGGPESDLLQFTNTTEADEKISISESQWKRLNKFVADSNLDLIICLNPLQRVKGVWDSRSTLELISMSDRNGYNLTWQLGYESQKLRILDEGVSGAELGRDIVRLRKILDSFPRYKEAEIIGPDITLMKNYEDIRFIKDYLIESGDALNAITWHPIFAETNAEKEDVLQSLSMVYSGLDALLYGKDHIPKASQYVTEKPMWIAESQSECYDGEFSDAIIWVHRLGTAARLGFYVFMHHVQEFGFSHPTPDFWVSLLYKNLVGRAVLDTRIVSGNHSSLQVFSHCTAVEEIPMNPIIADNYSYERGSVTMYGSNSLNEQVKISLKSIVKNEKVHIYILTGGTGSGIHSKTTLLNGQELSLSPSGDLPVISPKVRTTNRNLIYVIPPKSVFFIVLPEARVRTCSAYPATIVDENNNIMKRLRQGKSNIDTQDSIEDILVKDENNEFKSSELNTKETYVQFINKDSVGESASKGVKTVKGRSNGLKLFNALDAIRERFNIEKGKSSILKNKSNKYMSSNNELRFTNDQNSLKENDIATTNVKYVTFSDSSWLPNLSQTNYSQGSAKDIIQALNSTFNGYIEHANSTLKTTNELETNERRKKYTLLTNAIFGKRNTSSAEIRNSAEIGKELTKNSRRKRFIEDENLLRRNPIEPKSELLSYPTGNMPISSRQQNINTRKYDRLEIDRSKIGTMQKNQEHDFFPTGDIFLKVEDGQSSDFVNKEHKDGGDQFQADLDSFLEGVSREDEYLPGQYPGEFLVDLNSKAKIVTKDAVKNMEELSEAEFEVQRSTVENKVKLPEKENVNKVVPERRNDTHNKAVNKLAYQQRLTYHKMSNDKKLQQELSDYDDNKEGEVKKKEKAILPSLPNKQVAVQSYPWNSDDISSVSWETARTELEDYKIPRSSNNGRIKRAIDEKMRKISDELVKISTNHDHFETDRYYDKSEEDQLTRLLKEITDDSEKLLHVLADEQKRMEQGENNASINAVSDDKVVEITTKNILNNSEEYSLSTEVNHTTTVTEANRVLLGYNNTNLKNEDQSKIYDTSVNLKSVFEKNNEIDKKSSLSEMKRTGSDTNDERNSKEVLEILDGDEYVTYSTTTSQDKYDLRNSRSMIIDSLFSTVENKQNNTLTSDNLQIQTESSSPQYKNEHIVTEPPIEKLIDEIDNISNINLREIENTTVTEPPIEKLIDEIDNFSTINLREIENTTVTEPPIEKLIDEIDNISNINLREIENTTRVNHMAGLTDDENVIKTTISPFIFGTTAKIQRNSKQLVQNDLVTEISIVNDNETKQVELGTEVIKETRHASTEKTTAELILRNNILKSPIVKNVPYEIKLKSPLSSPFEKIKSNNFTLSINNETIKKIQSSQDRGNRPIRRNEQIELLRSRLTAYREHLNELTRKKLKNKREINMNYYNNNHILKKDNPYILERVSKISKILNPLSLQRSIQSNSELEMLFEPENKMKQIREKLTVQEESQHRNNDINKNKKNNPIKILSKNYMDTIKDNYNYNQQYISSNGQENEKYDLQSSPPLKYNMLQQHGRNIVRSGGENVNNNEKIMYKTQFKFGGSSNAANYERRNQIKPFNRTNQLPAVDIEIDEGELSKWDYNQPSIKRSERSVRSGLHKKITPRVARYIDNIQKQLSKNNIKPETGIKKNKITKITSRDKRSLDEFESKNSVNYWLSTNEIPMEKLSGNYNVLFENANVINKTRQNHIDSSFNTGLSTIKKVANQYNKVVPSGNTLDIKHMEIMESGKKHKSNDLNKIKTLTATKLMNPKSENKTNNIDKPRNNEEKSGIENQTMEQNNKTINLMQNAFSFLLNQIANFFLFIK